MKELKLDFDLYVKEKQEAFNKGVSNGTDYAFKIIIYYLNSHEKLKDFILKVNSQIGEINFNWEHLMKALGRYDEWEELKAYVEQEKQKAAQAKNEGE